MKKYSTVHTIPTFQTFNLFIYAQVCAYINFLLNLVKVQILCHVSFKQPSFEDTASLKSAEPVATGLQQIEYQLAMFSR